MKLAPAIALALVALLLIPAAAPAEDVDGIDGWRRWPSIDAAVMLRELDGPEDILEKAEIVEDRVDDLARFAVELKKAAEAGRQKLESWRKQRESLEGLATIKITGDAQTTERLRDLAARIRREESLRGRRRASLAELEKELDARRSQAADYRKNAEQLRAKESGG